MNFIYYIFITIHVNTYRSIRIIEFTRGLFISLDTINFGTIEKNDI